MIFGGLFNSYHSSYLSIYWNNIDLFVRLYLSWISLCTHHIYVIVAFMSSKDITFFIILRNILTKFFPSFLTLIIFSEHIAVCKIAICKHLWNIPESFFFVRFSNWLKSTNSSYFSLLFDKTTFLELTKWVFSSQNHGMEHIWNEFQV